MLTNGKTARRISTALTAFALLGASTLASAAPAGAATQCSVFGTWSIKRHQYASNVGNYIDLYYNSSSRCVHGSVGGYNGYYVHAGTKLWLDISFTGGRTWEGRVGQVSLSYNSPYGAGLITRPYLDSNRLARACTQINSGPVSCTSWF
ncbi:MAG: hypothetical protein ABI336_02120 [Humibacillus sp.]